MISIASALRRSKAAGEAGMGLIEVLVAVLIITIVATTSATLVINGIAVGARVERKQVAVTIASGALESVSAQSVAKAAATGVSALYTGRSYAAIHAAWLGIPSGPGVAQTYEGWDPTATATSTPALPITSTVTQAGTTFTITTLIGTCYQPLAGGDCGKVTGFLGATPPTSVPSTFTTLIRVMVIVSWTAGTTCTASGCSYTATTLVDPNSDLDWVTHA